MIFVTVGTHEQQFDRLVKEIDRLKGNNFITEDVIIQTGYSDYVPKYCEAIKFLKFEEMKRFLAEARIVITHGGPASFLSVLELKKTPIVVPRKLEFEEHVNNHQLDFSLKIMSRGYDILVVEHIEDLWNKINGFSSEESSFKSNNMEFNEKLTNIVDKLLGDI